MYFPLADHAGLLLTVRKLKVYWNSVYRKNLFIQTLGIGNGSYDTLT